MPAKPQAVEIAFSGQKIFSYGQNLICAKPSRLAVYRPDKDGPAPVGFQGGIINFSDNRGSFRPLAAIVAAWRGEQRRQTVDWHKDRRNKNKKIDR